MRGPDGGVKNMTYRRCSHAWLLPWAVLGGLLGGAPNAPAQGTAADYERASRLPQLTRDKVFKARVEPHWFDGNNRFWYRNDLAGGKHDFVLVDAVRGTREPAFDHARLAVALHKATGRQVEADRLPFDRITPLGAGDVIQLRAADLWWKYDRKNDFLAETVVPEPEPPAAPVRPPRRQRRGEGGDRSPDGRWRAFVKDHNVRLRDRTSGEEIVLSRDGSADDAYESEFYWSPDSKKLVALRTHKGDDRHVSFIESSPRDQLQPRLHSFYYLKPGDRIPLTKPHLFDVAGRKEIPVPDDLFPNPWMEPRDVEWDRDSGRFTFVYNQRGHQVLGVLAVDAGTGKVSPIIDERSPTFIDYAHKFFLRRLDATGELLWMSERDGWNHLYLIDARTGRVKNQITRGPWVVRGVDRVDEAKRQVWYRAGGIDPEQDPYYVHFCRVNFDGTGLVRLTEGDGTHAVDYSPDRRFLIDTYSRVDLAPVTEVRRVEDGGLVCELERADMSALLETGWRPPERFVAKGRDGHTDIYGVIYRPTNFDPHRKYPVLEDIYAGPQGSFVPKGFRPLYRQQAMAELGFVVVQIDGMGTSNRSKAFHDVCWKNLGDAGFPDRILWIKAAAAKYPCLDLARVGLYGVSAGGQSALGGLLSHPDFYKTGVAACGCHDNRMDKIWWNELWMGWPVGPHYAEQSNVTNAHKLQGKLLLIVGEMDHNVDPASTMQVVNALIKANKDFELLVVPGADHGIGGAYGARRQQDIFVRHLLGVEPRGRPN
jgi:dipeptidyl aminopeptidase/acylaminoacyl peptidase